MIEFTYSRITLCVCGMILLGSICIPLADMYSSNEDVMMTGNADRIAYMLDSMHDSDVDTITLRGWDILPYPDCRLSVDGYKLVLKNSKKEYVSYTVNESHLSLGYNEEIRLKITDGILTQS